MKLICKFWKGALAGGGALCLAVFPCTLALPQIKNESSNNFVILVTLRTQNWLLIKLITPLCDVKHNKNGAQEMVILY